MADEVFARLLSGRSLGDLGLGEHEGRIDLRGIAAPLPERLGTDAWKGWTVHQLGGLLQFHGARLADLDLSDARLESFRFVNSTMSNCRFDRTLCRDWRLWAVDVTDSSFVGADLRQAVLGAWYEGRGDVYRRVDFSRANMRQINCPTATFVDCDFAHAQLAKIEFESSSFIRCRFAGLVREVIFYDHGFKTGKPDPNPMEDVDFSDAELRMVEFRRLNLDRVKLPADEGHLLVQHYRCVLERALAELVGDSSPSARFATVLLQHDLKWAGPNQEVGVFNRRDLVEMGDEQESEFMLDLLRRVAAECADA